MSPKPCVVVRTIIKYYFCVVRSVKIIILPIKLKFNEIKNKKVLKTFKMHNNRK